MLSFPVPHLAVGNLGKELGSLLLILHRHHRFSQHNAKQGETYRVAHLSCLEAALSFRKIVPLVTSPHLSFPPSSYYHLFTHPGVLF